jgi:hypothetical protein
MKPVRRLLCVIGSGGLWFDDPNDFCHDVSS